MTVQETEHLLNAAIAGELGEDQQRIADTFLEALVVCLQKNHDYGGSAWKTPLLCPSLSAGDAILVRMGDKLERLANLADGKDKTPQVDETLTDTMKDLGAYAFLWLARPREDRAEKPQAECASPKPKAPPRIPLTRSGTRPHATALEQAREATSTDDYLKLLDHFPCSA